MNKISLVTCIIVLMLTSCDQKQQIPQEQKPQALKMTTEIPAEIVTPDKVTTRIGELSFTDGYPDSITAERCYDNLDFMRGVQAVLNGIPAASMSALRKGLTDVGAINGTIGIYEKLADSKSLLLTANTESVYAWAWLDLKNGPVVVESPPNVLGIVNDFWFRYVADLGNAGPDKGKGGKFLFLPPDYSAPTPKGYFVVKSATYGNILLIRGFLQHGDPSPAVADLKLTRIYPLAQANAPHEPKFVNLSGKSFNTIAAGTATVYHQINEVIQEEPVNAIDPETSGLLASIGIEKGKPFAPDERMKKILDEAAATADATARTLLYRVRNKSVYYYPNSGWLNPFPGGSYEFLSNGHRDLDAKTLFYYAATFVTPAMAIKMPGIGSQYAGNCVDANGKPLEGGKNYVLHLPPNVPVKNFWSIVVYDIQTRSMLQTDQPFPSLNSEGSTVKNKDGSYDIYFGPIAPADKENNWIQTVPGKGWNMIFRLYGPLEPWFDKSWKPGEIQDLK